MEIWFVVILVLLAIIPHIFSYVFKRILRQNGYQSSFFLGSLYDLPNFIRLIRNEPDSRKRRRYKLVLTGTILSPFVFVIGAMVLISMS
jgi:hypothetical protein